MSADAEPPLSMHPSLTHLQAALGELLFRELLRLRLLLWLLDGLLFVLENHLDVARGRHVRVDPPVRPVGAPTALLSPVHLHVPNRQVVGVEVLELSVGLGVAEKVEDDLAGLHRPAPLGRLEGLGLRRAPDAAAVDAEGYALL